jgi:hypothetical protein
MYVAEILHLLKNDWGLEVKKSEIVKDSDLE